jgi:hypothetical protein
MRHPDDAPRTGVCRRLNAHRSPLGAPWWPGLVTNAGRSRRRQFSAATSRCRAHALRGRSGRRNIHSNIRRGVANAHLDCHARADAVPAGAADAPSRPIRIIILVVPGGRRITRARSARSDRAWDSGPSWTTGRAATASRHRSRRTPIPTATRSCWHDRPGRGSPAWQTAARSRRRLRACARAVSALNVLVAHPPCR